jgi:hypothetical protein
VRVKVLGGFEARPDVVAPVDFVPAAAEGLIRSITDAVAFALCDALCSAVAPNDNSTVPVVTGFDGGRSSYRAASGPARRVRDFVATASPPAIGSAPSRAASACATVSYVARAALAE